MKILIENAVPLNNGDAALIFALGDSLETRGNEVNYRLLENEEAVRERYPNKVWLSSWLNNNLVRLPFIGYIYLFLRVLFSKKLREYDAIISAPGGYIHSYYSFRRKIQLLLLYKNLLGKKIYMYSQSIGNLTEEDEKFLSKSIEKFDLFYVRDEISYQRVKGMNKENNIYQTKDAAFLLENIQDETLPDTVAISVREWSFEGRSEEKYLSMIISMVKYLVNKGKRITFLSTCQGDSRYRDDSILAQKIYDSLPSEIKHNVKVDANLYTLNELRQKLCNYEYVIGTRLHMCILSWLSGTPALNISYEEKGREAYKYMGIENYSVDFNADYNSINVLEKFLGDKNHTLTLERVGEIRLENELYLEKLIANIKS